MFIVLLSFGGYLGTKCISLNKESCITIPTLVGLNPVNLKYYPFMTNVDKCNGSCNVVDDLPTSTCVSNKTKAFILKYLVW